MLPLSVAKILLSDFVKPNTAAKIVSGKTRGAVTALELLVSEAQAENAPRDVLAVIKDMSDDWWRVTECNDTRCTICPPLRTVGEEAQALLKKYGR